MTFESKVKIRLRKFYLPKHWFFSVCWRNSAKNRQKWRCQEKGNFFHFWTKMTQNDDCNFILPCFCPSNSTGFILFKHHGTCTDQEICLRWGITQMGEYALCVHLKGNCKNFADFETKQWFFFWLSLVCQNNKYWLRSECFATYIYIYVAYSVH